MKKVGNLASVDFAAIEQGGSLYHVVRDDSSIDLGNLKAIVSTLGMSVFLSVDNKIYALENDTTFKINILEEVMINYDIISFCGGYDGIVMVFQHVTSGHTRVFATLGSDSIFNYAKKISKHFIQNNMEKLSIWYEILDFEDLLEPGEKIVFCGSAAYSRNFISNRGRLFGSGMFV